MSKQLEYKHSLATRWMHWINFPVLTMMVWSGLFIYWANAVYAIKVFGTEYFHFFPAWFYDTLGIPYRLAEGIQLHFFFMWLFALNGLVYLAYGLVSGHFRRKLLPIRPRAVLHDVLGALRGRLAHEDLSVYNAAQRAAYVSLIAALVVLALSGLAIWKPVQFHWLAWLLGDFDNARVVHFLAMAATVFIVVVHVMMVILVPRTFPTMITGRARRAL